jgi:type IV pilus assembly protein PilE
MKKSFTLLEMLVVIGIIAILVTIGFASYSTVQKKARDSKRQSDLKAFQSAIEQCYSVNSFTYTSITGTGTASITETCPPATGGPSITITDPLGTGTYIYTVSTTVDCPSYYISVNLETSATAFTICNQQ